MNNLEKKSDIIVGLNHMANILGPLILFGLLVSIGLGNILPFIISDQSISKLLQTVVIFVILLIYIYKAGKYINGKFSYENLKKVIFTSMLSFFLINSLYIVGMVFLLSSVGSSQTEKNILDLFFEVTGFNNIISIIIYIIFYSLYYKISLKGLTK